MLVALMQTYLLLYGGSYLCKVTHDLLAVMGILIIFSCLFDTYSSAWLPRVCIKHQRDIHALVLVHVSNIKGKYMAPVAVVCLQ